MSTSIRKLSWALLLPLFLLFAQQAALRHELGHDAERAVACKKATVDADHCLQCLAYAQMSGAVKAEIGLPSLLAGLTFHFAPAFPVASVDRVAAAPRSRGPPAA